jgi:type VI secretion system secreted protein Hcp
MGIYWKPEKAAKGDATEKDHKDWIKVDSVSFSSGRTVVSKTGRMADRDTSTGQLTEITVTKEMDTASMNLFNATCVGNGEKMEIHVTRAGTLDDKSEIVYLKYELENALLTSYSFNSSGGKPSETLTINFTKMTMTHTPQDPAAKADPNNTVSVCQGTNKTQGS